jgi:hydrogenase expression/formation protein HypC
MCLAVPLEIVKIEDKFAIAKAGPLRRRINIQMLDSVKVGDFCLVHAGFAIQKIDPQAAGEMKAILNEMHHGKVFSKK